MRFHFPTQRSMYFAYGESKCAIVEHYTRLQHSCQPLVSVLRECSVTNLHMLVANATYQHVLVANAAFQDGC